VNVFELSVVATPVAGLVSGVLTSRASGGSQPWLAAGVGFALGAALYASSVGFGRLLLRLSGWKKNVVQQRKASTPFQWLCEMLSVLLVAAAPAGAVVLTPCVVRITGL
jgi:hypothetical protein